MTSRRGWATRCRREPTVPRTLPVWPTARAAVRAASTSDRGHGGGAAVLAVVAVPVGVVMLNDGGSGDVRATLGAEDPPTSRRHPDRDLARRPDRGAHVVGLRQPLRPGASDGRPRTRWWSARAACPSSAATRPPATGSPSRTPPPSTRRTRAVTCGTTRRATSERVRAAAPGSATGTTRTTVVQVTAGDKQTVQEIVGSAHQVGSVDGNGCPADDAHRVSSRTTMSRLPLRRRRPARAERAASVGSRRGRRP